ncbi:uncharacterized protein LOC130273132 [Hyla sarda]|uniref:uncharacterized protein LOC130273132 n=1 Tax=Hyla sarda TaxID=327740 RepID=UPI0024C2A6F6|nr:uncharacterized protein LOC130273132 [Hyla sarda]
MWRSVRDSFIKECGKNGTTKRTVYKYTNQLQFLRKCVKMRRTTTSTQGQQHVLQEGGPPHKGSQPSEARGRQTVSQSILAQLDQRGKRHRNDLKFCTNLIHDGLQSLKDIMENSVLELCLLQVGGEWSGDMQKSNRNFLISLLPSMDKMSENQVLSFKGRVLTIMAEIVNPPRPPTYQQDLLPPPPPSYPDNMHLQHTTHTRFQPPTYQQALLPPPSPPSYPDNMHLQHTTRTRFQPPTYQQALLPPPPSYPDNMHLQHTTHTRFQQYGQNYYSQTRFTQIGSDNQPYEAEKRHGRSGPESGYYIM